MSQCTYCNVDNTLLKSVPLCEQYGVRCTHKNSYLLLQGRTLDLVQFDQNVAAFSVAVCTFTSRADTEWYVVVGTAKDMMLSPRTSSGGALVLFRLNPDGSKLEHVHTVSVIMGVLTPISCLNHV